MKDNVEAQYVNPAWMVKTGGYARDMTLRDVFAALAMQTLTLDWSDERIVECYQIADAMLKERTK